LGFGGVGGLGEEVDLWEVLVWTNLKRGLCSDMYTLSLMLFPKSWKLSFTLGG
jgi:hypothetical protein